LSPPPNHDRLEDASLVEWLLFRKGNGSRASLYINDEKRSNDPSLVVLERASQTYLVVVLFQIGEMRRTGRFP